MGSRNNRSILLIGNGINRCFNCKGWNDYIKNSMSKNNISYTFEQLEKLPFTMRIVAASCDNVNSEMKSIATEMFTEDICEEHSNFLNKLLQIPVSDIMTTNYSLELELVSGIEHTIHAMYKHRNLAKKCTALDEKFRMYTYFALPQNNKRVWHIHGDVTTPSSLIMGHYYYGKLLHRIQEYIPNFMRRYKTSLKNNEECEVQSWVDLFLTCDVHIVGFGMDLSEIDLWWLICCKKRNFPNTKVYFYAPDSKNTDNWILLESYGVDIKNDLPFDGDYRKYYEYVFDILTD